MDNCIFCKIVKGEIPSYKVYEDDNHLVFLDIFPIRKGQVVVIPKKHIESSFSKADKFLVSSSIEVAQEISKRIEERLGAERCFVVIQGLGVNHFHVKLFPNYKGDGEEFSVVSSLQKESDMVLQKISDEIKF